MKLIWRWDKWYWTCSQQKSIKGYPRWKWYLTVQNEQKNIQSREKGGKENYAKERVWTLKTNTNLMSTVENLATFLYQNSEEFRATKESVCCPSIFFYIFISLKMLVCLGPKFCWFTVNGMLQKPTSNFDNKPEKSYSILSCGQIELFVQQARSIIRSSTV